MISFEPVTRAKSKARIAITGPSGSGKTLSALYLAYGITGDWSTLGAKSILDLVMVMVLTSSLGKGCVFSVIPIFVIEGGLTLAAGWIKPLMTELAMCYLSTVGSVLIFCVGVNLVWGSKIRTANLLPAVVLALAAAWLREHGEDPAVHTVHRLDKAVGGLMVLARTQRAAASLIDQIDSEGFGRFEEALAAKGGAA
jgi:hypothetical protein